jgi:DNA processing protein
MINKIVIDKHKELSFLKTLPQPVKELYVAGEGLLALLQKPRLAIVGSRRATSYGRLVTTQLGQAVASCGVVIVSGLALGIDSIAHQAALGVHGHTIAILPGSLEKIYPASHANLAKQVTEQGGVLISEYPPQNDPPPKHQFIARNRLIAAFSQAVLIPEAAARSGSLHTAQFALEQGKDILAVPGNITSPLSAGTNHLIATGATPVRGYEDVLEALQVERSEKRGYQPISAAEANIVGLLKTGALDIAELQTRSQLPTAVINQTLTILELNGAIQHIGSWWSIT